MRMLVVIAVAWSCSAWAVEITNFARDGFPADIQFAGAQVQGTDDQEGLTLFPDATEFKAWAKSEGTITTVGFFIHGPEWSAAFAFNNETGEALSDVWTIAFDWDWIEDVPHEVAFQYNLEDHSGRLQWTQLMAAEPNLAAQAATIPDGAWSPALLGLGIMGLAWRVNRR